MKKQSPSRNSELLNTLWAFKREFFVVGLFSMVANLLMLSPTLYMLQIYDRVMTSGSELTLLFLSLITLFLFAVTAFAEWSRSRLLVRAGVRLDEMLNTRVFSASFESQLEKTGKKSGQGFSDLTNLRQFLTGNGIFAFFDTPWTPIYMFVLFMLHPWLGLLSLVFAIISASVAYLSHRVTYAPLERAGEVGGEVITYLNSKLRNSEVIESMGMLGDLRRRWRSKHQQHLVASSAADDLNHRMTAISKFIRYSQQSLALGAGAWLVIDGELTAGAMIATNVLMGRSLQPIDMIVSTWKSSISAWASFKRLENLLESHPERAAGMVHPVPRGHIQIDKLIASAPGRKLPILKGLTADFPAGEVIAIVGPSGSGKSTLARVLVGVWPEVKGRVLLDGEPVSSWDREELGPHIGYLPQDIELFDGTLAENIARFGEIDSEKVIEAAQLAGVHDMILRFPQGYDTPMMANNVLSGGQRQRIGLARALYGNPSLIVLDEPNANLDDQGEKALLQALLHLKQQGKTVFLITHRTNIVGIAHRLLMLRNGEIQVYGPLPDVLSALHSPATGPTDRPSPDAVPQPA
jgi:ATP-binding cassette, subfamily C, bacterial exporter for protease/lipase